MDSQIISLNEELQSLERETLLKTTNNDTSMYERHEANYIQYEGSLEDIPRNQTPLQTTITTIDYHHSPPSTSLGFALNKIKCSWEILVKSPSFALGICNLVFVWAICDLGYEVFGYEFIEMVTHDFLSVKAERSLATRGGKTGGRGGHGHRAKRARAKIGIARLRFRYLSVLLSSSAVTYAYATFPCIGRNGFVVLYPNCRSYEGGSVEQAEQGDSASGGHGVGIDVVAKTIVEDVAPAAPDGPTVGGKSQSSIQRLLVRAVQNAEVRGEIMPTLPFVSSSFSTTPERENGDHTELLAGANLCAIGAPQRFVISSDSSDHSSVNIAEAEVDSNVRTSMPIITSATTTTPTAKLAAVAKEKLVGSSVFGVDSSSAGESHPISGGFSDCSGSDFLFGGIRTWMNLLLPNFSHLFAGWIMTSFLLSSMLERPAKFLLARRYIDEEIENLKAQLLLKEAKAIRLRAEISKLEAVEKSLRDEVTALNERNTILEKERNALDVKVTDLKAVVVHELQVSFFELKEELSNYENLTERFEEFQDAQLKVVDDKYDKLYADFVKLAIAKCLNSPEYLSALRTAVSKAIEKGMQDGLAAGITHGRECRVLTDVAAHNPAVEADYISALQQLQSVNFPLLAKLKANKDASIEAVINILRLEEHLAARIMENIMSHRSLFQDVFVPLAELLSAMALTCMKGTSGAAPATDDLTTALFVTLASVGTVTPFFVDDYRVMGTDD
nr:hypothetical protein [Tanacetum cinerariifolium]